MVKLKFKDCGRVVPKVYQLKNVGDAEMVLGNFYVTTHPRRIADVTSRYEQYERVFNRFDLNGDGKICPEELQRCVESIGWHMTAEEAVALADSDGDGLLCLEDFIKIVEGGGEDEKASDLKEAFRMYEMEGSGCITPKSLKRMLSRLGERRSVEQCRCMIAEFDLNGDGFINFDEFRAMMSC